MARLNRGEDFHGRAIDAPTSFFPGVAVNPTADDLALEAERFHRKVAAGARFAMTQILFGLEPLEAFRERIGGSWPIPVIVGVWPIRTYELLIRMHNETPGMVVPEHVQERYRRAGADAREVGGELGLELIDGARALAQGVYVVAPFRAPMNVVDSCLSRRRRRSRPASEPSRARADDRGRDAVAARRADARREDRRTHGAVGVDSGTARVAVPHVARDGRDHALDGAVAVCVLREDDRGAADPPRRRRERAVLSDSRGSRPAPGCRIGERAAASRRAAHAEYATSLCASNDDDVGIERTPFGTD